MGYHFLNHPNLVYGLWPLFKSSKFSLWPMYFVINELPYKLQIRTENMIISGLWFGESKPNMNVFLQPIFTELIDLESNGVEPHSSQKR